MKKENNKALIPQGWLRVIVFILVYFAVILLASATLAVLLIKYSTPGQANIGGGSLLYLLTFVTAVISVALVWLFTNFVNRQAFGSIGLNITKNVSNAMAGLFLGVLILCAGTIALYYSKHLQWTSINISGKDLFIGFGLMMIVALSEEIVFRGYILGNLLQSMNKWTAWAISAIIFAIGHMTNPNFSILSAVNILLAGLLLGLNYIYTRNLWFGIALHFMWNFFQGPVLGYEVSGMSLPSLLQQDVSGSEWITGGKFGFEGSAIATLFQLLAIIVLCWIYEKKFLAASGAQTTQQLNKFVSVPFFRSV